MATKDYIEKDLGIVTAYGEAVAGGYQGTRQDFQELLVRMANAYLNYNELENKPSINGVSLQGNKTTSDLKINPVSSYTGLTNKPSINGVTLQGDKTTADLNISTERSRKTKTYSITLTKHGKLLTGSAAHVLTWKNIIGIDAIVLGANDGIIPLLASFALSELSILIECHYDESITSASATVTLSYYE